jgi:hypothetical protein
MVEASLIQKIYADMEFLKNQIAEIRMEVTEINMDFHRLRPAYARKIAGIEKQGSFRTFSGVKELRREIEHVQDKR